MIAWTYVVIYGNFVGGHWMWTNSEGLEDGPWGTLVEALAFYGQRGYRLCRYERESETTRMVVLER